MMQRQVLSYQASLYGRATAKLHLEPLDFGDTIEYFPNFKAEERVALYAMIGGIPAYWERVGINLSISENIRKLFLTPNTLLQDEPRLLLQDFLKEQRNYVAILKALAAGRLPRQKFHPKPDSQFRKSHSILRILLKPASWSGRPRSPVPKTRRWVGMR